MLRLVAFLLSLFPSFAVAAEPEKNSISNELSQAIKTLTNAKSYAWTSQQASGPESAPVKAEYEKDKPLHVVADKLECCRQGNQVVYLSAKEWLRSRTGTLSDPLLILGAISKIRTLTLPHEELAVLLGSGPKGEISVENVAKTQKRISFALKDDAVRKLTPTQYEQVAREGKAELWIDSGTLFVTESRFSFEEPSATPRSMHSNPTSSPSLPSIAP